MKPEFTWLAGVSLFTAVLWVPYVLDRFVTWGIADTVGYPENPKPQSAWAQRLMKAHHNAVENLVVFAALMLTASAAGLGGPALAQAAMIYFVARVVHAAAYTLALPWVRTLGFIGGVYAQVCVAWMILSK